MSRRKSDRDSVAQASHTLVVTIRLRGEIRLFVGTATAPPEALALGLGGLGVKPLQSLPSANLTSNEGIILLLKPII